MRVSSSVNAEEFGGRSNVCYDFQKGNCSRSAAEEAPKPKKEFHSGGKIVISNLDFGVNDDGILRLDNAFP